MRNEMDDNSNCSSRDDGASDPTDTGSGNDSTKGVEHKEETVVIAKKETKDVVRLKVVVALVLIISTAVVAFTVHHTMSSNEKENFRKAFDDDADKILSAVSNALDSILGSFDSLAVTTVSMARATNQTWPFVTVPDFAVRMSKFVPLSRTFVVFMTPVVLPEQRKEWEAYTVQHDSWVNECVDVQDDYSGYFGDHEYDTESYGTIHGDYDDIPYNVSRPHLATWQSFPVAPNTPYTYNWDWLSISFPEAPMACLDHHEIVFSPPYMIAAPGDTQKEEETAAWGEFFQRYNAPHENPIEPVSDLFFPIVEQIDHARVTSAKDYDPSAHKIVGVYGASIYWRSIFQDALPKDSKGIHVVMENECSLPFTYQINGPDTKYMGVGDLHETKYDGFSNVHHRLDTLSGFGADGSMYSGPRVNEHCPFTLRIYPSDEMKKAFVTNSPIIFTLAVIMIFAFTALVFAFYDWKVERRQQTVLSNATRASAIVSSLFPSVVRDQLYPAEEEGIKSGKLSAFRGGFKGQTSMSESSVRESGGASPIASLYPDTTVLFADISGFTAWSSIRQPSQVFHLLESVYAAFDEIAKQRRIFKVETIGDSYVAVVGLPSPRKNHAVAMARFAEDCIRRMGEVTKELGNTLGPGTSELALRVGMNSGPTTAGVLRGEKSRFQLFGDTVNTASRMESTGERNRIQVSHKTADLLVLAGKSHWLTKREDEVDIKGKGLMTTFWCSPKEGSGPSDTPLCDAKLEADDDANEAAHVHRERLVDWNVDLLAGLVEEIVSHRSADDSIIRSTTVDSLGNGIGKDFFGMPLAEVKEVLKLRNPSHKGNDTATKVQMSAPAKEQLKRLVSAIAGTYRSNAFHNFEHVSHVAMSTKKLLDRIAENGQQVHANDTNGDSTMLFKIASDPLTRFALVFAALIHDVDHMGVSNQQLNDEQNPVAIAFLGKSVAEQNSINIAWRLLMQHQFAELRACIYATEEELAQLRALVVNVVMATDLFDKDLKAMRESRWTKSFSDEARSSRRLHILGNGDDNSNRKATVILELVIQASDVSHTMQHFTVYKKWNMNLLAEMYDAFHCGRTTKDPLQGWYEGELWFFDNYVIPLAKKLRECGVFGVSCDEFLDYATDNRQEWETKGRGILEEAVEALKMRPIRSHTDVMSEVYT